MPIGSRFLDVVEDETTLGTDRCRRDIDDEEEEDDDDEEEGIFVHRGANGILGPNTLLRVASSVTLSPLRADEDYDDPEKDSGAGDSGKGGMGAASYLGQGDGFGLVGRGGPSGGSPGSASPGAPPYVDDPGAAATMAVARLIAASGGSQLPQGLVRLMSPYQAHFREVRCLGKGGFGSVVSAVGRLDDRAVAVKKIHFRSAVPPWAKNDSLEGLHEELLREARALALMDNPHVVKYHSAWIEPRWSKIAAVGGGGVGGGGTGGRGNKKDGANNNVNAGGALARRSSFIVADDSASDSESDVTSESESESGTCSDSTNNSMSITDGTDTAQTSKTFDHTGQRHRARLLGGKGGASVHYGKSRSGIGYSEVWTPAAAAAAALRWPYTLHIAMELCPGSTLRDWIRLRSRGDVQAGAGVHIFRCLMEALRYVHAHGIIHRDIKPANILVHRGASELEPTVKLMDFGLAVFYNYVDANEMSGRDRQGGSKRPSSRTSREAYRTGTPLDDSIDEEPADAGEVDGQGAFGGVGNDNVFSVGVGTASYCAPEQRSGSGLYTSAVDMYSSGVMLVEMLTALGVNATESERLHLIADAKCLNLPEEMTQRFPKHAALARELLSMDPSDRPTAAAVLRRWPRINLRRDQFERPGVGRHGLLLSSSSSLDGLGSSVRRTQSLPESELIAFVDAVSTAKGDADAASHRTEAPGTARDASPGSPLGLSHPSHGSKVSQSNTSGDMQNALLQRNLDSTTTTSPSRLGSLRQPYLEHISEGVTPDEVSNNAGDGVDVETASRGDLAAEVIRLRERLAALEGQTQ